MSQAQATASNGRMNVNHELKNTMKEAVLVHFDVNPQHLCKGTEENKNV